MVDAMESSRDLTTASREELLAVIAAQQQVIAQLQQTVTKLDLRIAELEARLGSSGGKGMPGTKPAGTTPSKASGKPRKRRTQGYARKRMTPTRQVDHAPSHCPSCQTKLAGGWVVGRREVIDLPPVPVEVVEHRIKARACPTCRRVIRARIDLRDTVVGQQRLSARLVGHIATLREVGRLPIRTIQWLLQTLHGLHLSVGAIVAASTRVAARGAEAVQAIRDEIRASPAVAADETGWRENGVNGYVWTFATPTARYFVRGSREGAMVDTALGDGFAGVVSCDFYAGYHHLTGLKQRCWAHLLRDIHDLTAAYPDDRALLAWKVKVGRLYRQATAYQNADPRTRVRAQQRYEQRLEALCRPYADDPAAAQAKLCRRMRRHGSELFVFVAHPQVPSTNNLAERSLRPLVTARKISGGTRSPAGSDTKMATASLFGTWLLQGRDPLTACQQVLLAPRA